MTAKKEKLKGRIVRITAYVLLVLWAYGAWLLLASRFNVNRLENNGLVVSYDTSGQPPTATAVGVDAALRLVEGYWKTKCGLSVRLVPKAKSDFMLGWAPNLDGYIEAIATSIYTPAGPYKSTIRMNVHHDFESANRMASVMAHEVGHMLGLQHDLTEGALMFPEDVGDTPIQTLSVSCPGTNWSATWSAWRLIVDKTHAQQG